MRVRWGNLDHKMQRTLTETCGPQRTQRGRSRTRFVRHSLKSDCFYCVSSVCVYCLKQWILTGIASSRHSAC